MTDEFNATWKPLTLSDLQDRIKEPNDLVDLLRSQMRDQNMRTRDRFAMAALTGLLARITAEDSIEAFADMSYGAADAMMERRKK